jgi:glycosyltransferase A (GT-A) superfamily protein (DUF2064 family)
LNPSPKAILVFAQSPTRDAADKRLPGAERLFKDLTRQTLQKARRTGFPVFHFDEGMQDGNSFGERLSGAMQSLFDRGIEHLVVIGNDSPDLTTATLNEAVMALEDKKAVLGPADDGGVYLIGLRKDQFEYGQFLQLPWRQEHLFQQMILWIRARGLEEVEVLSYKMDLDTQKDFRNWSGKPVPSDSKIRRLISGLFHPGPEACMQDYSKFSAEFYPFAFFNKGSPCLYF